MNYPEKLLKDAGVSPQDLDVYKGKPDAFISDFGVSREDLKGVYGFDPDSAFSNKPKLPAAPPPTEEKGFFGTLADEAIKTGKRIGGVVTHEIDRVKAHEERVKANRTIAYRQQLRDWATRAAQRKAKGLPPDPNDKKPAPPDMNAPDARSQTDILFTLPRVAGGIFEELVQAGGKYNPINTGRGIATPNKAIEAAKDEAGTDFIGDDAGYSTMARAREIADDTRRAENLKMIRQPDPDPNAPKDPNAPGLLQSIYEGAKNDPFALGYDLTSPSQLLAGGIIGRLAESAKAARALKTGRDLGRMAKIGAESGEILADAVAGTAVTSDEVTPRSIAEQLPVAVGLAGVGKLGRMGNKKLKSAMKNAKDAKIKAPETQTTGTVDPDTDYLQTPTPENIPSPDNAVKDAVKSEINAAKNGEQVDPQAKFEVAKAKYEELVAKELEGQGKVGKETKTDEQIRIESAQKIADALIEHIDDPNGKKIIADRFYSGIGLSKTTTSIDPETGAIITKQEPILTKESKPQISESERQDAYRDVKKIHAESSGFSDAKTKLTEKYPPEHPLHDKLIHHLFQNEGKWSREINNAKATEAKKAAQIKFEQAKMDYNLGRMGEEDFRRVAAESRSEGYEAAFKDAEGTIKRNSKPTEGEKGLMNTSAQQSAERIAKNHTDPEAFKKEAMENQPEDVPRLYWARAVSDQMKKIHDGAKKRMTLEQRKADLAKQAQLLNKQKDLKKAWDTATLPNKIKNYTDGDLIDLALDHQSKGFEDALDDVERIIDKRRGELEKKSKAESELRGDDDVPGIMATHKVRTSALPMEKISSIINRYSSIYGKGKWLKPFQEDFPDIVKSGNVYKDNITPEKIARNERIVNQQLLEGEANAKINSALSQVGDLDTFKEKMKGLADKGVFQSPQSQVALDDAVKRFVSKDKVIDPIVKKLGDVDRNTVIDSEIASTKKEIMDALKVAEPDVESGVKLQSPATLTGAAALFGLASMQPSAMGQILFGGAATALALRSLPPIKVKGILRGLREAADKAGVRFDKALRAGAAYAAMMRGWRTSTSHLVGATHAAEVKGMKEHFEILKDLSRRAKNLRSARTTRTKARQAGLAHTITQYLKDTDKNVMKNFNAAGTRLFHALSGRWDRVPEQFREATERAVTEIRAVFDDIHNEASIIKGVKAYMKDWAPYSYDKDAMQKLRDEVINLGWKKNDFTKPPEKGTLAYEALVNVNRALKQFQLHWDGSKFDVVDGAPPVFRDALEQVNGNTVKVEDLGKHIVANWLPSMTDPEIAANSPGLFRAGERRDPHLDNRRRLPFLGDSFYNPDHIGQFLDYARNATYSNMNHELMDTDFMNGVRESLSKPSEDGQYLFGEPSKTVNEVDKIVTNLQKSASDRLTNLSDPTIAAIDRSTGYINGVMTPLVLNINPSSIVNANGDYLINAITRNPRNTATIAKNALVRGAKSVSMYEKWSKKGITDAEKRMFEGTGGDRKQKTLMRPGRYWTSELLDAFGKVTEENDIQAMMTGDAELKRKIEKGEDLSDYYAPWQIEALRSGWDSDSPRIRELKNNYSLDVKMMESGWTDSFDTPEIMALPGFRNMVTWLQRIPGAQSMARVSEVVKGRSSMNGASAAENAMLGLIRTISSGALRSLSLGSQAKFWATTMAMTGGLLPAALQYGMRVKEGEGLDGEDDMQLAKSKKSREDLYADLSKDIPTTFKTIGKLGVQGATTVGTRQFADFFQDGVDPAEQKITGVRGFAKDFGDISTSYLGGTGGAGRIAFEVGENIMADDLANDPENVMKRLIYPVMKNTSIKQILPVTTRNMKPIKDPKKVAENLAKSMQGFTPEQIEAMTRLRVLNEQEKGAIKQRTGAQYSKP